MKKIAVLRGGPSSEYGVSMLSGNAVLDALKKLDFNYKDIVITKKGEWLDSGFVKPAHKALEGVDVVFIALHGEFGEDGQVQRILQKLNIPFTGSSAMSSAIAFNKELTKNTLRDRGIKTPKHRTLSRQEFKDLVSQDRINEEISLIFEEIGGELFIKPVSSGSSLGAKHAPSVESFKLAIAEALMHHEQILIEEFIRGREAAVGILSGFRNEEIYRLPVIEIVPKNGAAYFSSDQKYTGESEQIVPGRFSYHEKSQLADIAALVHEAIDCKHYSRSDFIVRDGDVYFLELNTLPGLTEQSLFPKATASVGLEFSDLVAHLLDLAHPH